MAVPILHETLIKEFANWRETTQSGSTDITLKGQERTDGRHREAADRYQTISILSVLFTIRLILNLLRAYSPAFDSCQGLATSVGVRFFRQQD